MLSAFGRAFRTPDLRRKLLFTLGIITIFRLGAFIPSPGVDYQNVQQCLQNGKTTGGLYQFVNLFSGGALLQVSIFALGIMPYITARIIVQLLRVVIPRFQELYEEGASGQSMLTQYTRYLTIALGLCRPRRWCPWHAGLFSQLPAADRAGPEPDHHHPDDHHAYRRHRPDHVDGRAGDRKGVGNGMSLLIFVSIAAGFPASMGAISKSQGWGTFFMVLAIGLSRLPWSCSLSSPSAASRCSTPSAWSAVAPWAEPPPTSPSRSTWPASSP